MTDVFANVLCGKRAKCLEPKKGDYEPFGYVRWIGKGMETWKHRGHGQ